MTTAVNRLFYYTDDPDYTLETIKQKLPSVEAVQKVALLAIQVTATVIVSILMPYTTIGICSVLIVTSVAIRMKNKGEILLQGSPPNGFDEQTAGKALLALHKSLKLHELAQLTSFISLAVLTVTAAVNPVWLVISTCFLTLDWVGYRVDKVAVTTIKKALDKETQSVSELHELQRVYPEIFKNEDIPISERNLVLKKERKTRLQKKRYHRYMKKTVAKAWEDLLLEKKFTLQQGLEGDWNIFQPLCRLAVVKELQSSKWNIPEDKTPPSLAKRLNLVNSTRIELMKLNKEQQKLVTDKLVHPESQIPVELTALVNRVSEISDPMMQIQDLFQSPIISGSEWYCIKTVQLKNLLMLQRLKMKNYSNKLFFKSVNQVNT